jgi:hypothetical protein
MAQAFLICRLQKARAEVTVNFYGEANDLFRQQIILMQRCHFTDLSLPHCLIVEN